MTTRKYASEIETVVESPQRKLRRELGLLDKSGAPRPRVDDWFPFKMGQRVRRRGEKRVGEVVAWYGWVPGVACWPGAALRTPTSTGPGRKMTWPTATWPVTG